MHPENYQPFHSEDVQSGALVGLLDPAFGSPLPWRRAFGVWQPHPALERTQASRNVLGGAQEEPLDRSWVRVTSSNK